MKKSLILSFLLAILLAPAAHTEVKQVSKFSKSDKGPWSQYFQSKSKCGPNPFITKASELILKRKPKAWTVIDLGAGTGVNISELFKENATVHAYDADPESIKLIRAQFKNYLDTQKFYVYQEYFEDIPFLPPADLIVAWRSLPFMEINQFQSFWGKIEDALFPNGIFTGTFFGEKHYSKRSPKSPKIFRLTREEVLNLFTNFQIIDFHEEIEYDEKSSKSWGIDQFEHIYKVIAKKNA